MAIFIKRIYDVPEPSDGYRVLVDRLWPRGLRKEDAIVDLWLKDISPSVELRRWFGQEPERFEEFARRYEAELQSQPEALAKLQERVDIQEVTLLTSARAPQFSAAQVLSDYFARAKLRAKAS